MVMLVRAPNIEADSFIFVSKYAISGTVSGGCWIVSSVVLVGSTGRVIVEVSFAFLLAFEAASLFFISFLSQKSFRQFILYFPGLARKKKAGTWSPLAFFYPR